jgi:hypothetical protein
MAVAILPPNAHRFRLHSVAPRDAAMFVAACEIVHLLDPFGQGRATA